MVPLWFVCLPALAVVPLLVALWRARRRAAGLAEALRGRDAALAELRRLIRLTAGDLRGPALGLLGQAQIVPAEHRPPLLATARGLLDLAESLFDSTEAPDTPRRLREEKIALAPVVEFVVAQVSSQLGGGRRVWRLDDGFAGQALFADRRALHQALIRLVSAAALATAEGDWIELRLERAGEAARLVVEDEGTGLELADGTATGPATRGLGLGLALVRQLMAAHGGALLLESAARVGTRAVLSFPAARLLPA